MVSKLPSVIDLRPDEPYDNHLKVVKLLSDASEYIWVINYYFHPRHFELFSDVLKRKPKINQIRLLLYKPVSVEDLMDIKKEFDRLRKQYNNVSIQLRFFTESKLKANIHDRYFFTKDVAYSFIEIDTLQRNQRATISLLPRKDFKKNTENDFVKRWEDKKTFDILGQWDQLKDLIYKLEREKLEEIQKKEKLYRQKQVGRENVITLFKTNKGITVESEDNFVIELDEAIKECKNLETYNEHNGFPYIGFSKKKPNDTIQFVKHSDERWYAENPIINRNTNKWEGYAYKAYGTWKQINEILEKFFGNESFNDIFDWKITRFTKEVSKEFLDKEREKNFADLK